MSLRPTVEGMANTISKYQKSPSWRRLVLQRHLARMTVCQSLVYEPHIQGPRTMSPLLKDQSRTGDQEQALGTLSPEFQLFLDILNTS